jgi:hypothetical protein
MTRQFTRLGADDRTAAVPNAGVLQRKCACGGSAAFNGTCAACQKEKLLGKSLQTKLRLNEPGDVFEQEADRVAEQVMRMPDVPVGHETAPAPAVPLVQRRVSSAGAGVAEAPPIVRDVLNSPGRSLDAATRAFFESRFGHDFGSVRVHADERAAESARSVDAQAYTVGSHIVLGSPQSSSGGRPGSSLLAHELAHVVQQRAAAGSPFSVGDRTGALALQRQGGGGGAAVQAHRFSAEGVAVVVRASCAPAAFGFANVEAATRTALDAIFNTECIEESRRTRIQRNLTAHGLDIRCRRSANLETPGACAESTGFFIPANIFTLGSKSFAGHPDSSAGCQPMEATILHEIVHLTRGFAQESLPASCEASCFGAGGGDPTLCRDIDVFGKRHAP